MGRGGILSSDETDLSKSGRKEAEETIEMGQKQAESADSSRNRPLIAGWPPAQVEPIPRESSLCTPEGKPEEPSHLFLECPALEMVRREVNEIEKTTETQLIAFFKSTTLARLLQEGGEVVQR